MTCYARVIHHGRQQKRRSDHPNADKVVGLYPIYKSTCKFGTQLFQYSLYIKNHLQGDSSQLCIGSIWSLCWKWQYQSTIIHSTVSQARSTGLSLIQALEHHWSADACMGWEG